MIQNTAILPVDEIRKLLEEVTDPEIPVLNIVEMGIVRDIHYDERNLIVKITPTYSGCPAMNVIEQEVIQKLLDNNIQNVQVKKDYSKAWTTNWLTNKARKKLKEYGIAPPDDVSDESFMIDVQKTKIVPCPYCNSLNTKLQAEFGSTACKAQYFCNDCQQPFEHFKCH